MNRDDLKSALDYLRKKDPKNASLQKFDSTLRNYSGADQQSGLGSIKLYDNWYKNFSSETEDKRTFDGKTVTGSDGSLESKGYAKEMQKRAEMPSDYLNQDTVKQMQAKKEASQIDFWDRVKHGLGIDLSKEKEQAFSKENQVKKAPGTERSGVLGFLDSTVGRMGEKATRDLFGNDFANAQNQNYAQLAQDKLKQNPKDSKAITALQQLNTVTRAPKNTIEKASDLIGTSAGELAPYTIGGTYAAADKLLGETLVKNPLAKDLVRGALAGALAGTEKAGVRKSLQIKIQI
jgi:hypothetical protein